MLNAWASWCPVYLAQSGVPRCLKSSGVWPVTPLVTKEISYHPPSSFNSCYPQ
ncbi:UNVERIFIED_CONTAM: hypothetical protein GTU68_029346 [Idotea baltica]|nr:hypothetical protein [Idotea baltica]